MNEKKELTAADLALYIGCEAEWDGDTGYAISGINTTENRMNPIGLLCETGTIWVPIEGVKPILRPLSDMSEEEAREVYFITSGEMFNPRPDFWPEDASDLTALHDLKEDDEIYQERIGHAIGKPAAWRYLLSKHFDLFGWIASGLAIDKTKI